MGCCSLTQEYKAYSIYSIPIIVIKYLLFWFICVLVSKGLALSEAHKQVEIILLFVVLRDHVKTDSGFPYQHQIQQRSLGLAGDHKWF